MTFTIDNYDDYAGQLKEYRKRKKITQAEVYPRCAKTLLVVQRFEQEKRQMYGKTLSK